jgi:hypothetical protein
MYYGEGPDEYGGNLKNENTSPTSPVLISIGAKRMSAVSNNTTAPMNIQSSIGPARLHVAARKITGGTVRKALVSYAIRNLYRVRASRTSLHLEELTDSCWLADFSYRTARTVFLTGPSSIEPGGICKWSTGEPAIAKDPSTTRFVVDVYGISWRSKNIGVESLKCKQTLEQREEERPEHQEHSD